MTGTPTGKFKRGEDPRRGRGPKKGAPNAGRPPLAFARECAELQRTTILAKCRTVLTNPRLGPGHDGWEWAATYVSRYGEREVTMHVDLTTAGAALTAPLAERVAQVRALLGGAPCG